MDDNPKITMVIAHPDDEFLFGFPVIQKAKKIVACVDDQTHPTRQWCRRRGQALQDIGKILGIETVVLRYDSGFARISQANGEMAKFVRCVREEMRDAECIFTHNAWGEYGHLDHIFLNSLVKQSGKPVLTTDICFDADWYTPAKHPQGSLIKTVENDLEFHEKCMAIYRNYGAMGWTCDPIARTNLIMVDNGGIPLS